ncbi:MAG: BrnT family toxin [Candidatus Omnitrophota bacterium]
MIDIQFTWDENKNKVNLKKHKVSFEEAKAVFLDDNAQMIYDPDYSKNEDRFVLLGMSMRLRILVVCHCYRENDKIIRIISARKAAKKEKKQYYAKRI